ncbi:ComF family protein [Halobacillus sp. H74]|uniref:ComF family protein n=1 Tax=Halobacillus sp. H74 TaxID=3457436 RepID=UPI003FCD5A46
MERIDKPGCPVCYRKDRIRTCEDCRQWHETNPDLLENNTSVYQYNAAAKELVARWKYRGDYILLQALKHDVREKWVKKRMKGQMLVTVPLSEEREKERGFNQSEAIIHLLGEKPVQLFERIHSEKQSKKGKKERMLAENPFKLSEPTSSPVVIVDDIYTTGRTVRHIASLLRKNGCPSVSSFTIFR